MYLYPSSPARAFPEQIYCPDLLVAGGGLAGLCAALAAARDGLHVVLVQDRPVLGGNASSEVRLWANGATSHMGNNNRWSREGGIMGEILEENLWRNKEGNPIMFDLLLLDLAQREKNLTLLLNTAIFSVSSSDRRITEATGFNAINETFYRVRARQYCDATGDGVLGYLAGAEFRVGAEDAEELGEKMAPGDSFGQKLGHSIYFYTRKGSEPVKFVPPAFALQDIRAIPRYKRLTSTLNGCDLWWLEWGGRLDTVHDSEQIKWELWKIVWGVWNHIKNSGEFPEAENLTIDWVGAIPGKRESRRFIGDHILCQQDIIEQRDHYDAVGYGGWSIDLHPADGVYSNYDGCRQFHSKGTYSIPYRSLYSRSIDNLFLTGRLISASHVAFGSARVMCTCGLLGEVVGRAAALCQQHQLDAAQLAEPKYIGMLQQHLQHNGCYIPRQHLQNPALGAKVTASSELQLTDLPASGRWMALHERMALLLPVKAGGLLPAMCFTLRSSTLQPLKISLFCSQKVANYCADRLLDERTLTVLDAGQYTVDFNWQSDADRYLFIVFESNHNVEMALSDIAVPGMMTLFNSQNARVAKHSRQIVDGDFGVEEFEFWVPRRRPWQVIPAVQFATALCCYEAQNLLNGHLRPEQRFNGWVPALDDTTPRLTWEWSSAQTIQSLTLMFDNDFDNAMETVQMGHTAAVTPHCVTHYRLWADDALIVEEHDNHHSLCQHILETPRTVSRITLELLRTAGALPVVYSLNVK